MIERQRDEGTVLLGTLLVLSLMSAVALALLATLRLSIQRASFVNDRAQAELYARGAEGFALATLEQYAGVDPRALNAQLVDPQPTVLPFDNGSITLVVKEGSHCFRLSSLVSSEGTGNETARLQFIALLEALELDTGTASRLAAAAIDWVDSDSTLTPGGAEDGVYLSRPVPHRTANQPFESVSELRALDGMTEELFQRLRPFVCIGRIGEPTSFNINTAEPQDAFVLSAILGGGPEALSIAEDLIQTRPADGYPSREAILAAPIFLDYENPGAQLDAIGIRPKRVTVEAIINFGTVQEARVFAFEGLDNGRPELSYRDWGLDIFEPRPPNQDENRTP